MGTQNSRKGSAKPGDELRKQFDQVLPIALRFLQRRVLLALTVPLAIAAFVLGPHFKPPMYESEAVLLYRHVLRADVALGHDPAGESAEARGRRLCGTLLSASRLEEIIVSEDLYSSVRNELGMRDAILELRKDGTCRSGQSDTIRVQFRGISAELVFRLTHRLARELIEVAAGEDAEQAKKTQQFLQAEAGQTAEVLRQKEQQRAEFVQKHPEFSGDMGGPRAPASTADHRVALRREAERLRWQLRTSVSPTDAPPPPPASSPELTADSRAAVAHATTALTEAREKLAQAKEQYTPQHPDVIAAQNVVARAMTKLDTVKASARFVSPEVAPLAPAVASGADRARLERELVNLEHTLRTTGAGEIPSAQVVELASLESQWRQLTRELATAQERNAEVAGRLFRASIWAKATQRDEDSPLVLVDPPYLPMRPSSRGPRRTAALAAGLAAGMWWLGILALAILDDRIHTAGEVEQLGLGRFVHVQRRRRRRNHGPKVERQSTGSVGS